MKRRRSSRGREVNEYARVSVEMQKEGGYGEAGCDTTISVDGDVLCVVNEGLERMRKMGM